MKIKPAKLWVAVDTETTGLHVWTGDRPFVVSWCWNDGETGYVRWKVDPFTRKVQVDPKDVKFLKTFLCDEKIPKVFHNAPFDMNMLEAIGIQMKGEINDTMFALRVLENDLATYALKPVCEKLFNISDEDQQTLKKQVQTARRKGKKLGYKLADEVEADYWLVDDPKYVVEYATMDVIRTAKLWKLLSNMLKDSPLDNAIYQKEIALRTVVRRMEKRGVKVDLDVIDSEMKAAQEDYDINYKKLQDFTGQKDINIDSPLQMRELFYGKLGIEPLKGKKFTTATGQPKLDKKALEVLIRTKKDEYPAIQWYANCKAAARGVTMYKLYKSLAVKEGEDWVIHPLFKQMGAATGRFSCTAPNLQNVTTGNLVNAEHSIHGRRPFVPRKGYAWYSFDYTQMEFYIFSNYYS